MSVKNKKRTIKKNILQWNTLYQAVKLFSWLWDYCYQRRIMSKTYWFTLYQITQFEVTSFPSKDWKHITELWRMNVKKCVQIIFWVPANVDLLKKKKKLSNQNTRNCLEITPWIRYIIVLNLVTNSRQIWRKLSESNERMCIYKWIFFGIRSKLC